MRARGWWWWTNWRPSWRSGGFAGLRWRRHAGRSSLNRHMIWRLTAITGRRSLADGGRTGLVPVGGGMALTCAGRPQKGWGAGDWRWTKSLLRAPRCGRVGQRELLRRTVENRMSVEELFAQIGWRPSHADVPHKDIYTVIRRGAYGGAHIGLGISLAAMGISYAVVISGGPNITGVATIASVWCGYTMLRLRRATEVVKIAGLSGHKMMRVETNGVLAALGPVDTASEKPFMNGPWQLYHNGRLASNGWMIGEKQHGRWVSFHENGMRKSVIDYVLGDANGIARHWFDNGVLDLEYVKILGMQAGPCRLYYRCGQLKQEFMFVAGEMTGDFTQWRQNGAIEFRATVSNGRIVAKTAWNEDGTVDASAQDGLPEFGGDGPADQANVEDVVRDLLARS